MTDLLVTILIAGVLTIGIATYVENWIAAHEAEEESWD